MSELFIPERHKVYAIWSFLPFYQLAMPQEGKLVLCLQQRNFKLLCDFFFLCSPTGDDKLINGFLQFSKAFCSFKPGFLSEDFLGTYRPGIASLDFMVSFYKTVLTENLAFFLNTDLLFQFTPASLAFNRTIFSSGQFRITSFFQTFSSSSVSRTTTDP